jgi:hypothetical protein
MMVNFSMALLVYLIIGILIAGYGALTSPAYDEDDKELWDNHDVSNYMEFPKNPKLFFFCFISLVWPLHVLKKLN